MKNEQPPKGKEDLNLRLEEFRSKLLKLQNDWSNLKSLWSKADIENDPLKADEQIQELETTIVSALVEILNIDGEERDFLYSSAQKIRDENVGHNIQVRGVIEASNICRENCLYCPMRRDNLRQLPQKRITSEQMVTQARVAHEAGIKELFIQSGEGTRIIPTVVDSIEEIKSDPELKELKIIVNLGNHSEQDYLALAQAGASSCLIKHETSDKDLHEEMRPGSTLERRTSCLVQARKSGMYIGTGVIVGLPGQTDESLAGDIIYAGKLGSWEMVSCSPFTASDETPLKGSSAGDFYKTLNMMAIYRHLFPKARIPSVSNLDNQLLTSRPENLTISGQSMGINAGANGVTINLTPMDIRKDYKIYDTDKKRHVVDFSKAEMISKETGLPLDTRKTTEELSLEKNHPSAWNKIYNEQNPNEIPWNFEKVPEWFDEIIKSGWIKPCRTLDIGCGLGNYANYLSESGFNVLGVDFSEEVIARDREKFQKNNLRFEVCDALDLQSLLNEQNSNTFEFVIDISLLHHIKPEDREKYADSVAKVTKTGAKVLISCFSESDPVFKGKTAFHNPDTDTVTYVLSKWDIVEIFKDQFIIEALNEVEFGKLSKIGNSMTRRRHLVKLIKK
ncbi:MAG: methyltransferase type 12 [candidate division CPR2 bacterium GW2011_GWC1_39_9]|uniref:Radical SAM domain protein n=1 Tax=candidate division CPR2 bacterium GW2011_GWC2_39_10 TaxID=1618345 RepID=A0A0G0M084_UNCC2|nr:MAG: Radical SAM domain protein [candidate division CPR2 bacterium GW2011_GWC2_39_10]KKR33688.1 MAG: methyltransferase type 12 [candidate division CPR2 bacterium GW2011_GWC1_39_9]